MYPFGISVDEHVPLNMGAGRIFSDKGQMWIFQGQWCRRRGCWGSNRNPNVLIYWNPGKIPANPGKNVTQRCLTSNNGAQRLQKNTWILFLEITPKKGFLMGENLLAKVTQNFRQVWGLRATILRTSKNCPAPTVMSRDWPKIYLQVGPKVAKFHFHHSKQRKQLFLQKMWWENVKFKNLWGPYPTLRRPCL